MLKMHDVLEVSETIKFAFRKDDKLVTVHLGFFICSRS